MHVSTKGSVMARTQDSRRFYIDQGDNQAIIRTVPVRRGETTVQAEPTAATHQYSSTPPEDSGRSRHHGFSSRRMSQILRSARRRSHHTAS
jgi:hypothetical protein